MDHPCLNNSEGLLFQLNIWIKSYLWNAPSGVSGFLTRSESEGLRKCSDLCACACFLNFFMALAHLWVQLSVRLFEPTGELGREEWGWGRRKWEHLTGASWRRGGRGLARGLISSSEAWRLRLCASAWLEHRAWCLAYRPGNMCI